MMTTWQFSPYMGFDLVAVGMTLMLASLGWRLRHVRSAYYFSLLMLATALWVIGSMLGLSNADLAWKLAMLRFEYLGMISASLFWLLFVLTYTSYEHWVTRRTLALLLIVPGITYLQILTVEQHHWFYQHYTLAVVEGLVVSSKIYGLGFYLWLLYGYGVILFGVGMLVATLIAMPTSFRSRLYLSLVVAPVIVLPDLLYVTGHNLIAPYDPIALSFIIVGGLTLALIGAR